MKFSDSKCTVLVVPLVTEMEHSTIRIPIDPFHVRHSIAVTVVMYGAFQVACPLSVHSNLGLTNE